MFPDPNYFPCNCSNPPYVKKNNGHDVTGDLRLIENKKLPKLFYKLAKYRKSTCMNFCDAKKSISSGIDECIESRSKKKVISKLELFECKKNLLLGY